MTPAELKEAHLHSAELTAFLASSCHANLKMPQCHAKFGIVPLKTDGTDGDGKSTATAQKCERAHIDLRELSVLLRGLKRLEQHHLNRAASPLMAMTVAVTEGFLVKLLEVNATRQRSKPILIHNA